MLSALVSLPEWLLTVCCGISTLFVKALHNASALAGSLLRAVEMRMELFGLEMRQEQGRAALIIGLVVLACGSFLLLWVGLFALLAVVLPPGTRWIALVSCLGLLILVCAGSVLVAVRMIRSTKLPFHETRDELRKDVQCLSTALKKDASES